MPLRKGKVPVPNVLPMETRVRIASASPAMAAGIVAELWSVEDLIRAALAEPAGAPPVPQALTLPAQTGPVRQLPGGKGWRRLVSGGSSPTMPGTPRPPTTPAASKL
ncbi:hypothetical protein [Sorangium sp. So ce861]|uniref:hypothetical protein n=1 Tax=Sorangium sp. So ce861 TaxID=3133323 RepID=UPI003F617FD7